MNEQPSFSAHNVRIDAQPGHANIRIDDVEVGNYVIGYTLEHDVHNALPMLVLHTRHPAGMIFDGLARVAVADPQPPGDAMANFLEGIDAGALERAALERDDFGEGGSSHDITRAMLRQLADWARGRT